MWKTPSPIPTGRLCIPNKWGYKVNITHPDVAPIYEKWLKDHNLRRQFPLSDEERFAFEDFAIPIILKMSENKKERIV